MGSLLGDNMASIHIWIEDECKKFKFRDGVKFDGKRIFVDGKLVSDGVDYSVQSVSVWD